MSSNKEILFLEPYFADLIWGGCTLADKFNFKIPSKTTGEAWLISAYPEKSSLVINGKYSGFSLDQLWDKHPELFGKIKLDKFPLLIKFIDAKQDLSVQVHPDDAFANKYENGQLGKKECWYIVDCEENSSIIVGQKAKSKEELKKHIDNKHWDKILNEIPIKKGDFFQIDPGTVHAIKGGTLILETQQSSDLTYRVYDYDRKLNGKLRELHIDKALEVIDFQNNKILHKNFYNAENLTTKLIDCDKYSVDLINLNGSSTFEQKYPFLNFTLIEGSGYIDGNKVKAGDSWILPYNYGNFELKGKLKIISSHI